MNKQITFARLAALALLAGASAVASAQTAGGGGYWYTNDGQLWKNGFGQCWRAGYWTPEIAASYKRPGQQFPVGCECDKDLLPKSVCEPPPAPPAARPAAPAPAAPAARPAPAPAAAAPTSEKVTYAADAFFDFDKSVIKPEGKAKLDDLTGKLKDITLEVIIAVGHTDSVGSDKYNQKLSVRRAEAVKAYLVSKGIEANRIYTEGKGESQPVASNKTKEGRAKNRRVEIEVVGTRAKK
jgi:OmpA-OmpF porin, OOP family